ncbi:VOC family protein [Motiliproteus sp. MSK22-1]|uniref:VOC family protein n=1 Tax=Motiliproteus sp. MSK22-1 TaxID=1897630 RepID=UPI0009764465|nr:VOC family protein [Motiliproteus sp. MSK22-1]OMH39152.1 glyoxalase [Motiliproteus sp. MSK22-1]
MRLYAVRILVDDWLSACDFYENKLGLVLEFKDESFGWAEFDVGGAKFGIERVDSDASNEDKSLVGRFVGVSLQVDDVQVTYEQLIAKGVEFTATPEKQPWGGVLAHLKDTSGNVITLMSESR